ncbi:TRAP transporter small permease subunit [Membranihabitans marinus]|uniref:TRAP transporter small permease subunit n=1 Tax=Membranihabitans marinus TaxID=1227546 RepID=UPI001F44714B|nr:TRAP transporter small permease subunit [Membranihabitans marinus]
MINTQTGLKKFDAVFMFCGKIASVCNILLVFILVLDVILRYFFFHSEAWLTELEWHIFALIFLIGGAYTFHYDGHVRVDLIYNNLSKKVQAWINLLGTAVFLIPWTYIVIRSSYKYAMYSWAINEGSADPGGLAMRYLIKFAVVLAFVILLCYACLLIWKCILVIRGKDISLFHSSNTSA